MGVDLPSGSHLLKFWVMNLRFFSFFLRKEEKTLGRGVSNLCEKIGVYHRGFPPCSPRGRLGLCRVEPRLTL